MTDNNLEHRRRVLRGAAMGLWVVAGLCIPLFVGLIALAPESPALVKGLIFISIGLGVGFGYMLWIRSDPIYARHGGLDSREPEDLG